MAIVLEQPRGTVDPGGQLVRITIEGTAAGCSRILVTIHCGGQPIRGEAPVVGGRFEVVFGAAEGLPVAECRCEEPITVEARCVEGSDEAIKREFVLPCAGEQPEGGVSYAVKILCGVQADCGCACVPVRPGSYATEINLVNVGDDEVRIRPLVLPIIFVGAAAGRDPQQVDGRRGPDIVLPPHSATMLDCCRIAELLLGAPPALPLPLTTGFVELWSTGDVAVTAVYTASDLAHGALSLDVESIRGRPVRRGPGPQLERPQLVPLTPLPA